MKQVTIDHIQVSLFVCAVSAVLVVALVGIFNAAVRHDCRNPPRQVTLLGAVLMEYACPDVLDRIGR